MKKFITSLIIALIVGVGLGHLIAKTDNTQLNLTAVKSQAVPYNDNSGGYGVFAKPDPVLPGDPNFNPTHLPQVR